MADSAAEEQTASDGVAGRAGVNGEASKYVVREDAETGTVTEQVDIEDEGNIGDDESDEQVEEPTFSCDRCEYITKKKMFLFAHREFEHEIHAVSYTHLRAHETVLDLVCRLLLEKKKRELIILLKDQ